MQRALVTWATLPLKLHLPKICPFLYSQRNEFAPLRHRRAGVLFKFLGVGPGTTPYSLSNQNFW